MKTTGNGQSKGRPEKVVGGHNRVSGSSSHATFPLKPSKLSFFLLLLRENVVQTSAYLRNYNIIRKLTRPEGFFTVCDFSRL